MQVSKRLNIYANVKILVVFLVLLFGYLQYKLWVADGRVQDLWSLEQKVDVLREENKTLKERNISLQAEVENLKHGVDVIEEKARQDLGLVGKDETFIQFIEPERGGAE
jgi:cell division protein FtsB